MKIHILRHAEKEDGDYFNDIIRHQDAPITVDGIAKAKMLVSYFKNTEIKRIIVSEYVRTTQTAQYISQDKKISIEKDNRLNEIDNGIIEQMSDEEIKEKYPEFWSDFFSFSKDIRFPQGESGEEVKIRQKSLLDELVYNSEDVLLVSHEGYIRLLLCHLLDIPVFRRFKFKVDFCGITELEYMEQLDEWKIIRFNQIVI